MEWQKTILNHLITEIATPLSRLLPEDWQALEEIRLRVGQGVLIKFFSKDAYLSVSGSLTDEMTAETVMVSKSRLERMVMLLSKSSFYALEEELRQGYLTIPGGHRIGFAGEGVVEQRQLKTLKHISSLNFRIARSVLGAAEILLPHIVEEGRLLQTLLVSPPRVGKTTILRDLARMLSDGMMGLPPLEVGIADERLEIAAAWEGVPQLAIGSRCDVLSGCPKEEAMMLLIRSMAPDVILTDEIGKKADAQALAEALNAGIRVVATAHGSSYQELLGRPVLQELLRSGYFQRVIFLGRQDQAVKVKQVWDGQGRLQYDWEKGRLPC